MAKKKPAKSRWTKSFPPTAGQDCTPTERLRRRLRKYRGDSTQAQIAEALGVSFSWVSSIERGRAELRSEDDVITYASAIGAPPDEILGLWEAQFDEDFGDRPWSPATVLPDSLRRQTARAQAAREGAGLEGVDVIPGVSLSSLQALLDHDETARAAITAMVHSYEARLGRSRGARAQAIASQARTQK